MTIAPDRDTDIRWHTLPPTAPTLDRAPSRPLWRRVLGLLSEPMTVVLIVAALVSLLISGEVETPVVILVVVFNLGQWMVAAAVASTVLWAEEARKALSRARAGTTGPVLPSGWETRGGLRSPEAPCPEPPTTAGATGYTEASG